MQFVSKYQHVCNDNYVGLSTIMELQSQHRNGVTLSMTSEKTFYYAITLLCMYRNSGRLSAVHLYQ